VASVLDLIGYCAPGAGRKLVQGKERAASGRRLLEDCDWTVAAYEDASGARWPSLPYEEVPQVHPMTGNARQRTWRHICLLVRGSIELGSFFGASRSHAPLQDAANSASRQTNFPAILVWQPDHRPYPLPDNISSGV
jgi:hypothetical protein